MQLLKLSEVKKILNISKSTMLKILADGDLIGIKIRGSWRVSKEDLDQYINSLKVKPKKE